MICENKISYNVQSGLSENIDVTINNILKNITERNPVKIRDFTPLILVKNGVEDLPMYENPSHIRKNILTEVEAKELGLSIGNRDHYHGLGKKLYIESLESIDNPRVIFKYKNKKEFLILTLGKDSRNK